MKIFILLFCLQYLGYNHDIQVAVFKIQQENNKVTLDVTMELEDILTELQIPSEKLSEEIITQYLKIETAFFINGNTSNFEILSSTIEEKHLVVQAIFEETYDHIQSLMISNTCLLSIEDQSNIIELRLNSKERDFLMNKHRTMIEVDL